MVYSTIKLGQLFRCQREKIIVANDVHSLVDIGKERKREVITQQHTYTYLIIILLLFSLSLSVSLSRPISFSPPCRRRRRRCLPFLSPLPFLSSDSFSFDQTNVDLIGDSKSCYSRSTRVSDRRKFLCLIAKVEMQKRSSAWKLRILSERKNERVHCLSVQASMYPSPHDRLFVKFTHAKNDHHLIS